MTDEQHNTVRSRYDTFAGRYDERWARYVERSIDQTLQRAHLSGEARVLDVGCGTGVLLARIAEAHPRAALAGVDLSDKMLEVARGRLAARADLVSATASGLPFEDHSFTTVVSSSALHYFPDPRAGLVEMFRVLEPGGELVLTDWCADFWSVRVADRVLRWIEPAHSRTYGGEQLRSLLYDADFCGIDIDRYKIDWLWGLMTARARRGRSTG
jgi:ubiquinone/menaquinone biosynthesis C-methylase UbiE